MCPFVESLKLKDGMIQNLDYHTERLNRSRKEFYPEAEDINLKNLLIIPEKYKSGLYKVRILYGRTIDKIKFESYIFRTVKSLKVVHHGSIDYHLKFTDRQILQELFAQRADCDDIIIIKNGFVTDSFAANLLFFDGDKWYTPTTPLLKGTKRQFLLDRGFIAEKEIREEDIKTYQKVGLINALIDIEEMPDVPVEMIF